MPDLSAVFEEERPRLARIAERILGSRADAEDVVQRAWLRLAGSREAIESLPAWLTTVTTRLCLDQLRARRDADPLDDEPADAGADAGADPADHVALADTVGVALQVVLDRLTPAERVSFVLHDSFGFDFTTIADMLETTSAAARKLASRARAKVAFAQPGAHRAPWEVVDAFLDAARHGEFARLLELLAPDVVVVGDAAAIAVGTPARIEGREAVATMFDGAAKAARPVFVEGRAGAAWFHEGTARVAFDFTIVAGRVAQIDFRAEPAVLAQIVRRRGADPW